MEERLPQVEDAVRAFLQAVFSRVADSRFSPDAIARTLADEVLNATRRTEGGRVYAPDQYTLSMHPADVEALLAAVPAFQHELALRLQQILNGQGFLLVREPHVTLATDPTLGRWEARVFAWRSRNPPEAEAAQEVAVAEAGDRPPPGAFLIVEGKRHFPLTQPVIRIGRRHNNDLILSDPHVSRRHAEVRLLAGRYVLVDLGSSGGTYVNGRQIKQHILDPGDVISIAVVQLIYGEDPGGPPRVTPPYTPPKGMDRDQITPHYLRTLTPRRRPNRG